MGSWYILSAGPEDMALLESNLRATAGKQTDGLVGERALQESSCLILFHMRYCLRSTQTLDEFSRMRILTFVAPSR